MKKIFYILFLLPILGSAQPVRPFISITTQEYWEGGLDQNHIGWAWGSRVDNTIIHPIPGGRTVKSMGALFNAFTLVGNPDSTLWLTDTYNQTGFATMTQVPNDTTGAAVKAIACWGFQSQYFYLSGKDSSLWTGNIDFFNIFTTSGAVIKPIQMTPNGVKIRSISMSGGVGGKFNVMAISSDSSTVYTWAAGSKNTPGTITAGTIGTHKILYASNDGGNQFAYASYFLVQMTPGSSFGHPCVIGNNCTLFGGASGCSTTYSTLTDIYSTLGLTSLVKEVAINGFTVFLLDSAHNLYSVGGYNPQGQLGLGSEAVNQYTYTSTVPNPYSWDFIIQEYPVHGKHQVGVGVTWNHIVNDGFFVFYNLARDINDSVYYCGRGKQNIMAQAYTMQANDYANHPNCCDLLSFTMEHALSYSVPVYAWNAPSWSAGSNQTITTNSTTLTATGAPPKIVRTASPFDTVGYTIASTLWTQVSGPNTATLSATGSKTTTATGLINGTYVFGNLETDNNTGTQYSTVTVVVNLSGATPPTVSAGSNQTIILPTSSSTLAGSATANSPATSITTYAWTQLSGPNTGTFNSTSVSTPTFSGLIAGVYVLKLTVTDNNGNTNNATVTITVVARPTVSAGSGQTITLPTGAVTLAGSASANSPATSITTYAWTQVSGPNTGMLNNPAVAGPTFSGVIAGTYVLKLTVTDNLSITNSATVNIVVNPAPSTNPTIQFLLGSNFIYTNHSP